MDPRKICIDFLRFDHPMPRCLISDCSHIGLDILTSSRDQTFLICSCLRANKHLAPSKKLLFLLQQV